ncbi:MAG TPA: hypothetical protein VD978_04790 [Azospirillum sp.]|nr:hypothetical protein [Azospirillum sp.]
MKTVPIGEGFLSPEQQYLLKARREAERRQARHRQVLGILALATVVIISASLAWLSGWMS